MEINYCTQWSRHYKRFHKPMTEEQAREAHDKSKLYTAVLGPAEAPWCFVEVSAFRSVCVEFLDALSRNYRYYSFQELEKRSGKLFISRAGVREYFELSDNHTRGTVCYFKPDGRLAIEHYQNDPPGGISKIVATEELHTDVSDHWEPYPDFGHYEGLARVRNIPHLKL